MLKPDLVKLVLGIQGLPSWLKTGIALGTFLGIMLMVFLMAFVGFNLLPDGEPIKELLESTLLMGALLVTSAMIFICLALTIVWVTRLSWGRY